jgi:hypothetical protein
VIPLPAHQVVRDPHPLKCIYVLRPPDARRPAKRMTIRRLSPTKACLTLIANTFNAIVRDPVRLKQQFNLTTRLAHAMPVSSISFPHGLPRLPSVVEAIKKDLSR